MRFNIRSLLIATCFVAVAMAAYLWVISSPVLRLGMERSAVLSFLDTAGAVDVVGQKINSGYVVYVPSGDPAFDKRHEIEWNRVKDIPYNEENLGRFWYLFPTGTFEVGFENDQLESITCWNGNNDDQVDRLVLRGRPK